MWVLRDVDLLDVNIRETIVEAMRQNVINHEINFFFGGIMKLI